MTLCMIFTKKLNEPSVNHSINQCCTHGDQVLLHKGSQHVVPYGGHNVTEVQGRDDAILLLVLLGKCLTCMFQLQLLKDTT